MDMSNKYRKLLGFSLFVFNAILCVAWQSLDKLVAVLGSTSMPFITFIIPGALYYTQLISEEGSPSRKSLRNNKFCLSQATWEKLGSIAFLSLGLV